MTQFLDGLINPHAGRLAIVAGIVALPGNGDGRNTDLFSDIANGRHLSGSIDEKTLKRKPLSYAHQANTEIEACQYGPKVLVPAAARGVGFLTGPGGTREEALPLKRDPSSDARCETTYCRWP